MLEQLLNHIGEHALFQRHDNLLVAVSGGLDSMVMLDLLHRAGYPIAVAHVNFQLREAASDGDETFVRDYCNTKDIPFHTIRFDTAVYASREKLSIQMAARALRYDWFNTLCAERGYTCIATAHHLNDTLETILLHWTTGASLEGLTGIAVKNGNIVRPMLFATREQIEGYARQHALSWREDASNQTDDYQRNFIRHQVIPKLKDINQSLEHTVQRGLLKLAGDTALANQGLARWQQDFVNEKSEHVTIQKSGLEQSGASGILWRYCKSFGFSIDVCVAIIQGLKSQSGKRFFSATHQLIVDRTTLVITPITADHLPAVMITSATGSHELGRFTLTISESDVVSYKSTDRWEATLDADRIQLPLTWRVWQAGDAFYPLGMNSRKKISDFLIDNKISLADKQHVTILTCGDDVLWVVGYRINNRFKITDSTTRVISLHVVTHFR